MTEIKYPRHFLNNLQMKQIKSAVKIGMTMWCKCQFNDISDPFYSHLKIKLFLIT